VKFTVPLAILGVLGMAIVVLFLVPDTAPSGGKDKKKERTKPSISVGSGDSLALEPPPPKTHFELSHNQSEQPLIIESRSGLDVSDWPEDPKHAELLTGSVVTGGSHPPLDDEQLVLGVVASEIPLMCRLDFLRTKSPVINIEYAGRSLAIGWDFQHGQPFAATIPEAGPLVAFLPTLHGTPILMDTKSGDWWAPVAGVCVRGSRSGATLELHPTAIMSVKAWRSLYPDSLVIDSTAADAGETAEPLVLKAAAGIKSLVIGFVMDGQSGHLALDRLSEEGLLVSQHGEVVVLVDRARGLARAFRSSVGEDRFSFVSEGGQVVDRETDSTWEPALGRAISGPSSGTRLTPLPVFVLPEKNWKQLRRDSTEL
jgi:hypothetical protein